ncbi:unnamed protein product [Jaminaea pallidilutea]
MVVCSSLRASSMVPVHGEDDKASWTNQALETGESIANASLPATDAAPPIAALPPRSSRLGSPATAHSPPPLQLSPVVAAYDNGWRGHLILQDAAQGHVRSGLAIVLDIGASAFFSEDDEDIARVTAGPVPCRLRIERRMDARYVGNVEMNASDVSFQPQGALPQTSQFLDVFRFVLDWHDRSERVAFAAVTVSRSWTRLAELAKEVALQKPEIGKDWYATPVRQIQPVNDRETTLFAARLLHAKGSRLQLKDTSSNEYVVPIPVSRMTWTMMTRPSGREDASGMWEYPGPTWKMPSECLREMRSPPGTHDILLRVRDGHDRLSLTWVLESESRAPGNNVEWLTVPAWLPMNMCLVNLAKAVSGKPLKPRDSFVQRPLRRVSSEPPNYLDRSSGGDARAMEDHLALVEEAKQRESRKKRKRSAEDESDEEGEGSKVQEAE